MLAAADYTAVKDFIVPLYNAYAEGTAENKRAQEIDDKRMEHQREMIDADIERSHQYESVVDKANRAYERAKKLL